MNIIFKTNSKLNLMNILQESYKSTNKYYAKEIDNGGSTIKLKLFRNNNLIIRMNIKGLFKNLIQNNY